MPMRSFTAPDGEHWQVWKVVPGASVPGGGLGGGKVAAPAPCSPGMEQGWLCFQSGSATRRLAPPPADWHMCAEERLVRHWHRATPARPSRASLLR